MKPWRLFVGCGLDEAAHARVVEVRKRARRLVDEQGVRASWVKPANLHVTVKFLGDVDAARVDAIAEAIRGAAAGVGPIEVSLPGIGRFPHVLFQEVRDDGSLSRLAEAVDVALGGLGFAREARPFHPHVTLARLKQRARAGGKPRLPEEGLDAGHGTIAAVTLYRSELGEGGSRYTELSSVPLSG